MNRQSHVPSSAGASQSSHRSYNTGFVLAALLTLLPFGLAMYPSLPRHLTFIAVLVCALVQIVVHMVFASCLSLRLSKTTETALSPTRPPSRSYPYLSPTAARYSLETW